jgi:membrane associated rhomboid family serine protease
MSLSAADPEYDTPRERVAPRLPPPVATYTLIAVNVAMFGLERLWSTHGMDVAIFRMGGNVGREALLLAPWRMVSSAFLHWDPTHLLMNMWALFVLGASLERLLGPFRFLVLYAVSAVGGGLGTVVVHESILSAGASGAIWGLMVAQIAWLLRMQRRYGKEAVRVTPAQLAQPLIINVVISMLPGVDWAGHFGGGLFGGLVAFLLPTERADDRPWRPWALLGVLLMAGCVMAALLTGKPWTPPPARLTF